MLEKIRQIDIYYVGELQKLNRLIMIHDAKKAYGNFKNHGISKVNKNGLVKLYFNCPQAYSTIEKGKK